jgi:hypothetical protein
MILSSRASMVSQTLITTSVTNWHDTRDVTLSHQTVFETLAPPFLSTFPHHLTSRPPNFVQVLKWVMMEEVSPIVGTSSGTSQKPNRPTRPIRLAPGGSSALCPRYVVHLSRKHDATGGVISPVLTGNVLCANSVHCKNLLCRVTLESCTTRML